MLQRRSRSFGNVHVGAYRLSEATASLVLSHVVQVRVEVGYLKLLRAMVRTT